MYASSSGGSTVSRISDVPMANDDDITKVTSVRRTRQEEDASPEESTVPRGCRRVVMAASFLAFVLLYAVRVSLSVVLVAMTKPHKPNATVYNHNASNVSTHKQDALFQWSLNTQGIILAAFFYGYIVSQVPAILLVRKCAGGRLVMLFSLVMTSLLSAATPMLTRYADADALVGIRVAEGLAEGLTYPAMRAILAKWAPPAERSSMVAVTYAGSQVGTILVMPVAGLMSHYLGWDSVFYFLGLVGTLFSLFWFYCVHDSPSVHPRIEPEERDYIVARTHHGQCKEGTHTTFSEVNTTENPGDERVPWDEILRSMPVYATAVSHFTSNWTHYLMLTCLPLYLRTVLRFKVHSIGLLSAIPFVAMWLMMVLGGHLANQLLTKRILATTTVRQLFNTVGFLIPAGCLLGLSYAGSSTVLSFGLLSLAVALSGLSTPGWAVNHFDLAPTFAVELVCITNLIGTIPGVVVPSLVALLVQDNRSARKAWSWVFLTSAGVYAFGTAFYWIYGSGRRQWWSYTVVMSTDASPTKTDVRRSQQRIADKNPTPTGMCGDSHVVDNRDQVKCIKDDVIARGLAVIPVRTLNDDRLLRSQRKPGTSGLPMSAVRRQSF